MLSPRIALLALMIAFPCPGQQRNALAARIGHFAVQNLTFEDTIKELARQNDHLLVIGLETASPAAPSPHIRISAEGQTVREILNSMCAQDNRYKYDEPTPGVINIVPVDEPRALATILNLPVPKFEIDVQQWPGNLFARVPDYIPQVGEYLYAKVLEWSLKTGNSPPGSAGALMSTNITPPTIKLSLESTNVRGVLNALAAYTLSAASDQVPYATPSGWAVQFTADPHAPTGLDGYLQWQPLP